MKAGVEIALMITKLQVISYLVYKFDLCALFRSGQGKRLNTIKSKGTITKYINNLGKVMELLYIISAVCVCVGAYDTLKQYHAIKQLDKQLKQSLTLK